MYTSLYRKLRSRTFGDMIGQEHITKTLRNQVAANRISHAYLFCGIRGTGKTSVARILSRAVNCENSKDGEPCNECDSCLQILEERSMDVIEMNAASTNSVDDVRQMIDECMFTPQSCKYKVYIIDEVHMFSSSAFNAFLKILEEPPQHVIFMLATTESQKLPITILSRCQRFDLRRIAAKDIAEYLKKQSKNEGIGVSDSALAYISLVADGSMRDALNVLEQCAAVFFDCEITEERVQHLLGAADTSVFFSFTDALYDADMITCLKIIEDISLSGRDISRFVSDVVGHFRNILVASLCEESAPIDLSPESIKRMCSQGKKFDPQVLSSYIYTFSELQSNMRYFPVSNSRSLLEIACIKLLNPQTEKTNEALIRRVAALEAKVGKPDAEVSRHTHTDSFLERVGGDIDFEVEIR